MSQYVIYLSVPSYLDQWLRHEYWNATTGRVEFERSSNCHAILSQFLKKEPAGYERGDVKGLLPVEVPTFKGMNPDQHNFLIDAGRKALVSALKRNFKTLLDRELSVFYSEDVNITELIEAFMAKHGIRYDPKDWETIRQMFYRLRGKSVK